MEVLDPEFLDAFSDSIPVWGSYVPIEKPCMTIINDIRLSNVVRLFSKSKELYSKDLFAIIYTLFHFSTSRRWLLILARLFHSCIHDSTLEDSFANSFFRKYRFYYRKKMHLYRVGYNYYQDDCTINVIALSYAYLLYCMVQQKDFYLFVESLYNFLPIDLS
nr:hypothetical protein [Erythrotrichia foliiformis]